MLQDFFRGKRVLITGNTGFKGSWLSLLLSYFGADVYGYALPPEEKSLYRFAALAMPMQEGDIRDCAALEKYIKAVQPELVFHLAAHSSLYRAYEIPQEIFQINVMGTVALLEIIRKCGFVKAVVVVTSDKVYKEQEPEIPYRESCALGAADPYSTSKACQELVSQCYSTSFLRSGGTQGAALATARSSNTVGGGDYNDTRLLPYLLQAFLTGQTALLRNPQAIRPWQYVLDVLYGYLLLARQVAGEGAPTQAAYNFGPRADGFRSVSEVAACLASHFPQAAYRFEEGAARKKEASVLKLDSAKAQTALGWEPLFSFEETMRETARFAQLSGAYPVKDVCNQAIEAFLKRAEERQGSRA